MLIFTQVQPLNFVTVAVLFSHQPGYQTAYLHGHTQRHAGALGILIPCGQPHPQGGQNVPSTLIQVAF